MVGAAEGERLANRMLALACLAFMILARFNLFHIEPWMTTAAVAAMLAFGALWLASVGKGIVETVPIHHWVQDWFTIRRVKREVVDYIPFMTPKEKQIIAYLLHKNQKSFDCAADFGHAASLAGRKIVTFNAFRGQQARESSVPAKIPDYVWRCWWRTATSFPTRPS